MQTSKKNWNTLPAILPVVCLLSSLTSIAAIAQEQAPEEDESFLEEVVVTGTRIKRRDFSSPSPLTTITREDFEFSGQPTLEGYLNQMPQVQPGFDRTANNPGDGTAQIDLRGMGPNRTLVLMNGRRLAPSGVGSAVDANNLPVALVDRVEIITGGASTVYGSDAVAGVVNFITRDDFEGLNLEGSYYLTEQGDAKIWDVNLVYGHELQGGDGNITVYAGLYEREALFAGDREFTSIPLYDNWEGELLPGGSTRTPAGRVRGPLADLGNGPVSVTFNPDGTPREFVSPDDLWNYAPVNYLQLPLTRKTVGVLGHFAISDNLEAYFEAAYTRNDIKQNLAPAPMEAFLFTNVDNPLWVPEMRPVLEQWEVEPGLAQMLFSRRMLELGNRIVDREREYTRLVAGVRGEIFNGWEMDAWTIYTKSDEVEIILNNGSVSRVQQALLVDPLTGQCFDTSSGCVPADVFGEARLSPEAVDYIRWQPLNNITSREQYLANIVITGSPFDIWTGPVDMAFGAEWRRDTVHFETDPILFSGDVMGNDAAEAPIDGKESVLEFYTEAIFTLFESGQSAQKLDIEIGARWSDYANAGSVTTWKAGLDWRITPSWRVRAMAQHAVRAPNNSELFTQQNEFSWWFISGNLKDPCSASSDPAANGNVEKCLLQGLTQSQIGVFEATPFYPVDFISGGNPDLVPESSDTFTVGFVFTPISVPSLTIAVDYYDLEVTDTIGDVDVPLVCFDSKNSSGVFCDDVQRDASGNIAEIAELFQNRGLLATDGIDFQAQYLIELPDSLSLFDESAQLSISTIWTHVFSTKDQENVVTTVLECSGFFGWPCQGNDKVNPENRINTNFNYSAGPFTARLTWRWIDGMVNAAPKRSAVFGFPDPDLAIPDVDSWSYFDLGFGYQFGKSTTLRFVINNITDKKPAFMGSDFSNNTSASIYDVFGRSYQLGVSYQLGGN